MSSLIQTGLGTSIDAKLERLASGRAFLNVCKKKNFVVEWFVESFCCAGIRITKCWDVHLKTAIRDCLSMLESSYFDFFETEPQQQLG